MGGDLGEGVHAVITGEIENSRIHSYIESFVIAALLRRSSKEQE